MMGFQCKVTGIEQMYFRLRQVLLIGLRTGREERRMMPPPNRKQRRPMFAEIGVEGGVQRYVATIVEDEIELDFLSAGIRPSTHSASASTSTAASCPVSVNVYSTWGGTTG